MPLLPSKVNRKSGKGHGCPCFRLKQTEKVAMNKIELGFHLLFPDLVYSSDGIQILSHILW
jgi:hypothetical protein